MTPGKEANMFFRNKRSSEDRRSVQCLTNLMDFHVYPSQTVFFCIAIFHSSDCAAGGVLELILPIILDEMMSPINDQLINIFTEAFACVTDFQDEDLWQMMLRMNLFFLVKISCEDCLYLEISHQPLQTSLFIHCSVRVSGWGYTCI